MLGVAERSANPVFREQCNFLIGASNRQIFNFSADFRQQEIKKKLIATSETVLQGLEARANIELTAYTDIHNSDEVVISHALEEILIRSAHSPTFKVISGRLRKYPSLTAE